MKYKIILSNLLFIVFFTNTSLAQTNLDCIVAIVGDKIILKSDIENQIKQAQQVERDAFGRPLFVHE